jgi:hypothetical protein
VINEVERGRSIFAAKHGDGKRCVVRANIVLCTHCHEIEDERRAAEAKRRSEAALNDAIWESGLNTFATKKWGEHWYMTHDYYDVAEEYAESLEKRRCRDDWN